MNLCLSCRDITVDSHGGLARSMRDLAEALAQAGHSVRLLTDRSEADVPHLGGVSIVRVPVPPASGPFASPLAETAPHNLMHAAAVYREVRRIHEHERPVDAVLAPLWRSEGAVCALDGRFPTVVSCMTSLRTLTEIDAGYQLFGDLRERLALERAALSRSRYLHGLTEAVLAKTIADYDLQPELAAVIGRGLRDRRGQAIARESIAQPVRVLFVGRLERRKGVDTLLAAARALVDEGLAVTFTLVGPNADSVYRSSFEQAAAARPALRSAVSFTGAVSDAELDRLYAESDIVCAPSRYESHGVVLIEAMMFGKPIVTCDAGGIGEVVQAGRNALVSPPDEPVALAASLSRLCADPELRARLGAAGRVAYEQRFDARAVARQMESFLERVIARQPAQRCHEPQVTAQLALLLSEVLATGDERELAQDLLASSASA
jgi:glycogen(starch) synthase